MARRKALTLAYATVNGGEDFRERAFAEQDERLSALVTTAVALKESGTELLILPAGYFQVPDLRGRNALERKLARELDLIRPRFGIVVGVDVGAVTRTKERKKSPSDNTKLSAEAPPFFALYRGRSGERLWMQQVNVHADEGRDAQLIEDRWDDREVLLVGTKVALLICGESWSDVLMENYIATSGARALAVTAHSTVSMHGRGTGWENISWHLRLDGYARRFGIPIILAEHTRTPDRHPYCWPKSAVKAAFLNKIPKGLTVRIASV